MHARGTPLLFRSNNTPSPCVDDEAFPSGWVLDTEPLRVLSAYLYIFGGITDVTVHLWVELKRPPPDNMS